MNPTVTLMLQYAKTLLARPYKWGGDDPLAGFDCSGFVQECLASIGMDPKDDQSAQALYDHFAPISSRDEGPGALIFFGSSVSKINHVALAVSAKYMFEYGGGGSGTNTLNDAIKQNAYGRMRPIASRKDVVAIVMPRYP